MAMEVVPIFDWLRWIEVPIWLAFGSWLVCHAKHDHQVEVDIREKLAKLDGIETSVELILTKIIPEKE